MTVFSAFLSFQTWKQEVEACYGELEMFGDAPTYRHWIRVLESGIADEAAMRLQLNDPTDSWVVESEPILQLANDALIELRRQLEHQLEHGKPTR